MLLAGAKAIAFTAVKDKLQRSALHLVATEGIERLSTRRLSAGCGLSDPYIYQCYSDIPELLADTFLRVDCEVAELMRTVIGTQFIAPAKPVKLVPTALGCVLAIPDGGPRKNGVLLALLSVRLL